MSSFYELIEKELNDLDADFGVEYDSDSAIVSQVQSKINSMGYTPALVVDGKYGPNTAAGVKWLQTQKGLSVDGIIGPQTLTALGIKTPSGGTGTSTTTKGVPAGPGWQNLPPDPIRRPSYGVAVATMAKAIRAGAAKLGKPMPDSLLVLMLGQMFGAEGAAPGLWNGSGFTLRGTNNIGASQNLGGANGTSQMAKLAALNAGWGAFAHRDSNPGGDAYIGWYIIAPSVQAAVDHWLTGYAGVTAVLNEQPSDAQTYAGIMYDHGYFTGLSTDRDTEVGKYASSISRAMGTAQQYINGPANDPNALSVDPKMFDTLANRKITEDLFNKAKSGSTGSAWEYLLPAAWSGMQASNGVVFFGQLPAELVAYMATGLGKIWEDIKAHPFRTGGIVAGVGVGVSLLASLFGGSK